MLEYELTIEIRYHTAQLMIELQNMLKNPVSIHRVPTPPGKSWIFSLKFQDVESLGKSLWSWKVLEKYP